jgi:cadmium resistance protein CadD (predicted permease)
LLTKFTEFLSLFLLYGLLVSYCLATEILGLSGIVITAFAATDIDDLLILVLFFSDHHTFPARHVVIGQFLGIGLLIAISLVGVFLALVVPPTIIALFGIAPISIGIKKLLELRKWRKDEEDDYVSSKQTSLQQKKKKSMFAFFSVAAVTFSNGGDNIGVYVPLFATYNSPISITSLVTGFLAMTAVWCMLGYYLVNHPFLATRIKRYGDVVLPFVLIGLGVYILLKGFV